MTGAGEGNRTLVVSLGSCPANGLTMRVSGHNSIHKKAKPDPLKPSIHAAPGFFVERIFGTTSANPDRR
jgi:hypothetical protein